jgi:Fe-S-cluster containining protein
MDPDQAGPSGASPDLQRSWFDRIERLHRAASGDAGLECSTRCTARCCPQAIATRNPGYAVGHVAILLPFELEYILARTDLDATGIRRASFELEPGVSMDIGYILSPTPCPFLTADFRCGVHEVRPLDCRSFPLIPVFDPDGPLGFREDASCPSLETFAPAFVAHMRRVWEDLLPHLPMSYRLLYNRL